MDPIRIKMKIADAEEVAGLMAAAVKEFAEAHAAELARSIDQALTRADCVIAQVDNDPA